MHRGQRASNEEVGRLTAAHLDRVVKRLDRTRSITERVECQALHSQELGQQEALFVELATLGRLTDDVQCRCGLAVVEQHVGLNEG